MLMVLEPIKSRCLHNLKNFIPTVTFGFRNMSTTKNQEAKNSPADNSAAEDVIVHKVDTKRVVILNRPKALNALNLSMIRKIYSQLQKYNSSPDINLIIIKSEGDKAFCAGGDVKAICESRNSDSKLGQDFFREEYKMNHLIGTLQVPYLAIIDGITMGGGAGLSVHGTFRVATERTLFAMPECQIGLFTDAGGTHFLPRLKGKLGTYLALTGHRLRGREVSEAGIATHFISSHLLKDLEKQLLILKAETVTKGAIASVLSEYALKSTATQNEHSTLKSHIDKIDRLFDAEEVEGIIDNLKLDGSEWARKIIDTLSTMSPTSLKISMRALTLGSKMTLKQCLEMEYRLSQRCYENNDFHEGVRAALIDKTNKPKWNPASLDEVTAEMIDHYFSPLPADRELNIVV